MLSLRLRIMKCVVVCMCLHSPWLGASDTLPIPFYDNSRPPLIISTDKYSGIYAELFTAVLKQADIDFELFPVPAMRKRIMFENGEMALSCCSNPAWRNRQKELQVQLFSLPIYESTDHYIFNSNQIFNIAAPSDLKTRVVGTVRGFTYPDSEWFGTDIKVQTEEKLLELLHLGRVEVAIVNKEVAEYYINKNGWALTIGPEHDKHALHIRVHKQHAALLPSINQAITQTIRSGRRDQIIKRHLHPD
ncbi:substrate-binding periplasmic protein [Alteromonas sediminis]|nr:transporter substrate-binding domain-containing protein [Alteromonas sediminis]